MSLTQHDYETLASHAVGKHLANGTSLNDSILKIAEVNDLNGDQVKRVVEIANTKTFLKMFKTAENKGKNIEFDVADSDKILADFYGASTGSQEKTASFNPVKVASNVPYEFETQMEDMLRDNRHEVAPPMPEELMIKEAEAPRPKKHVVAYRLKKIAGQFYEKLFAEEQEYQTKLDKIGVELRKDYNFPVYEEVEKTAMLTLEGVEPVLDDIRARINWRRDKFSLEKNAARNNVVDTENPYYSIVKEMFEHKCNQTKYANAYKVTQSKLKQLES